MNGRNEKAFIMPMYFIKAGLEVDSPKDLKESNVKNNSKPKYVNIVLQKATKEFMDLVLLPVINGVRQVLIID